MKIRAPTVVCSASATLQRPGTFILSIDISVASKMSVVCISTKVSSKSSRKRELCPPIPKQIGHRGHVRKPAADGSQ